MSVYLHRWPWLFGVLGALSLCARATAAPTPLPTSITLTVSNQNPAYHTPLNVTATVTLQSNGAPVTGGTVTFFDGIYQLGSAQVQFTGASIGRAVLTFSVPAGPHSLTANYSGIPGGPSTSGLAPSVTASALAVSATGQEVLAASCLFYDSNYNYVFEGGIDPAYFACTPVYAFGLQLPTGVANLIDQTTGAVYSTPIVPLVFDPYFPFFFSTVTLPGVMNSFISADFGHTGVAGLIAVNTNGNEVITQEYVPENLDNGPHPVFTPGNSNIYPVASAPVQVVAADVNGDGNLDVVVAHNDPAGVGILLGNGDGTFQSEVTYSVGNPATNLAVGDVNDDGFPDVVVTNSGTGGENQLTVLLNNGNGTFKSGSTFQAGVGASQVELADLNGDGILDIAVLNLGETDIGILTGNGDGTFQNQVTWQVGTQPIVFAIADVNGDGVPDFAIGGSAGPSEAQSTFLFSQSGGGYQLYNDPSLIENMSYDGPNVLITSVQATDLDGDGVPDLLWGFSGNTYAITYSSEYPMNIYTWLFLGISSSPSGGATSSMAAADLNGDGIKDILTIPNGANKATFVFGTQLMGTNYLPLNITSPVGPHYFGDSIVTNAPEYGVTNDANPTEILIEPVPQITFNPSFLEFGPVAGGAVYGPMPVTLTNSGSAPLTISSIVISGTGISEYTQTNNCPVSPATLAAGSSCTILVTFIAPNVGAATEPVQYNAILSVSSNANTTPQPVQIVGWAESGFALVFSESVTVTDTEHVGQAVFIGAAGGIVETIHVTDTPSAKSNSESLIFAETVHVTDTASSVMALAIGGNGGVTENIHVTDTPSVIGPAPAVSLSATTLTFASQGLGTTSALQTMIVKNVGSSPLVFGSTPVGFTGAGASSFRQVNTCASSSVSVGATCFVQISFLPDSAGPLSATVTLADNASNSPQTISVSGTGVTPTLSLNSTSLTFDSVNVGSTSAAQNVIVTNTSSSAGLWIGPPVLTGANAAEFGFVNQCTVPSAGVPAGQTCTISVTFAPTTIGSASATLTLNDYAPGAPQQISLSATGIAAADTLTPNSLNFASVTESTTSGGQIVTVTNTGNEVLTFNSISIEGANSSSYSTTNSCGPVAPGSQCRITVYFSPSTTGPLPAMLSVSDNAAGSPQTVSLAGTGVPGPVNDTASVSITSSAFIYSHAQQTYSGTVTIKNTGAIPLSAPLYLVLTQLPAGVTATNAGGTVPEGPWYTSANGLPPGVSIAIPVVFKDPTNTIISFQGIVYSGGVQ